MDTSTYLGYASSYWQLALVIASSLAVTYWLIILVARFIDYRHLARRNMVWLEITPPASVDKTPEATNQLFSVIHGSRASRRLKDKVLRRSPVMSFEIVSTRKQGIRYLVQVEDRRAKTLEKIITSYIPDSKVKKAVHDEAVAHQVVEFKETSHFILPITLTSIIEQHDPLSYITGAMTRLSDNEEITLQLIVKPIKLREASSLSHKILGNENILSHTRGLQLGLFGRFARLLGELVSGLTELTREVHMGTAYGHRDYYNTTSKQKPVKDISGDRPKRTLSVFELELMDTMHQKVTQPLFEVNLRVLIKSDEAHEHISAMKSALDGFSVPLYQSLRAKIRVPVLNQLRTKLANDRLPALRRKASMILSASELASLYHFPSNRISKTDNLITSLSRTLPAPVSLKSGQNLAVKIGENHHHGTTTPIGLTDAERERHLYIIGGTGNGKTTMLFYSIVQDIQNGKGVAVLDPHGDLAERILHYIPEDRIEDVIYMNPDDLMHPIAMNLLEIPPDLTGDDLLREKDLVTEATISVLRKVFSEDDTGGHRIEYVLRNSIQTALTLEGPTLFTIFELLNDAKFRRSVVKNLEDQNLRNFWKNELGKAGEFQRVKMAAGITAKIGRFLFSASAKRVLEQPKSTINFDDILSGQKILICNFSKGLLGEDTSTLFGTTVLAKLQTAALRRARITQNERTSYYLYVDEFQNFATMSFVQMLSEARKYKLFLTMAEQSTSQQDQQRLVDIILANVGTVVCFRSGSPADERLMLPLFSPFIQQGEIANLPAYSYYARIAAIEAQEPMSGMTIVVEDKGSSKVAQNAIESSRRLYAGTLSKPADQLNTTSKSSKTNKNHVAKSSGDELAVATPAT